MFLRSARCPPRPCPPRRPAPASFSPFCSSPTRGQTGYAHPAGPWGPGKRRPTGSRARRALATRTSLGPRPRGQRSCRRAELRPQPGLRLLPRECPPSRPWRGRSGYLRLGPLGHRGEAAAHSGPSACPQVRGWRGLAPGRRGEVVTCAFGAVSESGFRGI